MKRNSGIIFWLIAIAHLVALFFDLDTLRYITKPLILLSLLLHFGLHSGGLPVRLKNAALGALVFSLAGDVLLMVLQIDPGKGNFFLFGLGAFLIAHLLYIASFRQLGGHYLKSNPVFAIPVVLFLLVLLWILWPDLPGDLQIPVAVYALVISLMALSAMHFSGSQNKQVRFLLIAGAVSFMVSDSLIALSKFSYHTDWSMPIMGTYILAQWWIVEGLLKSK